MKIVKNSDKGKGHFLKLTGDIGYKGYVYKGQPVIRERLAGTESFPFILL